MQTQNPEIQQALQKGHVIEMTTIGRQSGEPRRIEIYFHNIEGHLYISGIPRLERRSWLANLDKNPDFTFHLKGSVKADLPARARIIENEDERRRILTLIAAAWKRADVEAMVRYSPLIEVILTGRADLSE